MYRRKDTYRHEGRAYYKYQEFTCQRFGTDVSIQDNVRQNFERDDTCRWAQISEIQRLALWHIYLQFGHNGLYLVYFVVSNTTETNSKKRYICNISENL